MFEPKEEETILTAPSLSSIQGQSPLNKERKKKRDRQGTHHGILKSVSLAVCFHLSFLKAAFHKQPYAAL